MVINVLGFISVSHALSALLMCVCVRACAICNLELSAMLISGDFEIMDAFSAIQSYS